MSPYYLVGGVVTIGAADLAFAKEGSTEKFYNFTSTTAYTIAIDGFTVGTS